MNYKHNTIISDFFTTPWHYRLDLGSAPLQTKAYDRSYWDMDKSINDLFKLFKNWLSKNHTSVPSVDFSQFHTIPLEIPKSEQTDEKHTQLYPLLRFAQFTGNLPPTKSVLTARLLLSRRWLLSGTPLSTQLFNAFCQMQRDPHGLFALYKKANVAALLPIALLAAPVLKQQRELIEPEKTPASSHGRTLKFPYKTIAAIALGMGTLLSLDEEEEKKEEELQKFVPAREVEDLQKTISKKVEEIPKASWSKLPFIFITLAICAFALIWYFLFRQPPNDPSVSNRAPLPIETTQRQSTFPNSPETNLLENGNESREPSRSSTPQISEANFTQNGNESRDASRSSTPRISETNFLENRDESRDASRPPTPPAADTNPPPARPSANNGRKSGSVSTTMNFSRTPSRFQDLPGQDLIPGRHSAANIAKDRNDIALYPYLAKVLELNQIRGIKKINGVLRVDEAHRPLVIEAAQNLRSLKPWR